MMTDHTEEYASTLDEHWPAAATHMRELKALSQEQALEILSLRGQECDLLDENQRMREALTNIMSLHDHDSRTYRIAEKGMAK